jgi:phosphoenolpyruvate---glycerone phosphotransferase subunit DhaL
VIAGAAVHTTTIHAWMTTIAESVKDRRDYLTQLDAAIGDGDHGVNMDRGFEAVSKALAAQDASLSPGKLLTVAGKTLVSTVGGASGPLWGTAFRRAGRALGDKQELDGQDLVVALRAGLEGVVELGAAQPGDKTMVDALGPAIDALAAALDSGEPLDAALSTATEAAESGAKATVPLQARKGRASYLGERSIGHQDPGATSAALIMAALQRAVEQDN